MPRRLPWETLAIALPRADAEILLDTFKTFTIVKSDLYVCSICTIPTPHAMRAQLLRCACASCAEASPCQPCPWRGRVRTCQELKHVNMDELYAHVTPLRSPPSAPRLTPAMKEVAQDWAAQGLKPLRIWNGLMRRFSLGEREMPALASVQRFVHHHVTTRLGGSDLLGAVRLKIRAAGYTSQEDEATAFTFAWRSNSEGKPEVGNGTDRSPFIVGISSKKLLRHADRDPSTFVLHVDATYKLSQVGYPVIVVGISDKARQFHLLAVFIVSQEREEQYTEVFSLLCRLFQSVTGKPLRVRYAMGDADLAQWNALQAVFGVSQDFCFLMCFFHVAKKVYEKTRGLDGSVAAMVMSHLHELHFTRSEDEYNKMLKKTKEEWSKWTQLGRFKSYFEKTWLNARVWRWQCFHTPSGFATTNNPCESFNAALKRDVTLRRKLKVGALVEQLMVLCTSESVRARQFAASTTFSERLCRRARAMTRQGLLYEQQYDRTSIAFLLSDAPSEQQSDSMNVVSIPCTRIFDVLDRRSKEDLPASAQLNVETAKMEHRGMPTCGWQVNVAARTCPCRFFMKHGACIHLLYCLNAVGSLDVKGRETLFYRGTNKRKRAAAADEPASQAAGRPRHNGQALSIE